MRHARVIGWTRKGRPVYAIAGGSDSGVSTGGAGDGAGGAGTGEGGSGQGAGSGGSGDGSQGGDGRKTGQNLDEAGLQRELQRARDDAARYRTERNADREKLSTLQQQMDGIQSALGVGGNENDPKTLQQSLTQTQSELRDLRVRDALRDVADEAGADAKMVLPYLKGLGKLDGLDPSSDTLQADLLAMVREEVEKNPRLKADSPGAGGGPTGGEFNGGGQGEARIFTREQLRNMDPDEFEKHSEEINRQAAAGLIK